MTGLPSASEASQNVLTWSAANASFAAALAGGLPAPQALAQWGLSALKEGRLDEAAACFQSALALQPTSPSLWLNCGLAYDQAQCFSEAAACFERSLALAPRKADAWLLLGLVRKKMADTVAAEAAYRRALELKPKLPVAWQCLSLLKEEQRDYPAAILCLRACIQHCGGTAAVHGNLGKLCFQTGRFPEALAAFQTAVEMEPANLHFQQMLRQTRFLCDILTNIPMEDAISAYRASSSANGPCPETHLVELFDKSIAMLGGFGQLELAQRLSQKRLELWPVSATIQYVLQALSGEAGLDRSPTQFVIEHFNASAESFDARLVRELGYDIPEKLAKAITEFTPLGHLYDTLDAGCGTGLCGPWLRAMSRQLVGVDLSPKMLEQAARRGLYDRLDCEELTSFLDHSVAQFDLVVATDVFIYFGDLAPVMAEAAKAIRPGGLLAFSTENGSSSGYRLLPSGRFAHASAYIQFLAKEQFVCELCAETTIRLEANQRLGGSLFLLRRR